MPTKSAVKPDDISNSKNNRKKKTRTKTESIELEQRPVELGRAFTALLRSDLGQDDTKLANNSCKCTCPPVIMPNSKGSGAWNLIIAILLVYTITVLPVRVAFETQEDTDNHLVFDAIVDILFFIDMIVVFNSGYELDTGFIETNRCVISKQYLKSWFFIDLLAVFPFAYFGNLFGSLMGKGARTIGKSPRIFKMTKIGKILKMFRIYRFKNYVERMYYQSALPANILRIVVLFFAALTMAHISGCVWYLIGDYIRTEGNGMVSWLHLAVGDSTIEDLGPFDSYLISFYWALATLSTVGYGDIKAQNSYEVSYSICIMVAGTSYFTYLTGAITSIVTNNDAKLNEYRHFLASLQSFIQQADLTKDLQSQLSKELSLRWKHEYHNFAKWDEMRKWVSPDTQWKIINGMYPDIFAESDTFKEIKAQTEGQQETFRAFIVELASHFRGHEYRQGEEIAHEGEKVLFWYLISNGRIMLELNKTEEKGLEYTSTRKQSRSLIRSSREKSLLYDNTAPLINAKGMTKKRFTRKHGKPRTFPNKGSGSLLHKKKNSGSLSQKRKGSGSPKGIERQPTTQRAPSNISNRSQEIGKGWSFGECALFWGPCWQVNVYTITSVNVYMVPITFMEGLMQKPENMQIFECLSAITKKKYKNLHGVINKTNQKESKKTSRNTIPNADRDWMETQFVKISNMQKQLNDKILRVENHIDFEEKTNSML